MERKTLIGHWSKKSQEPWYKIGWQWGKTFIRKLSPINTFSHSLICGHKEWVTNFSFYTYQSKNKKHLEVTSMQTYYFSVLVERITQTQLDCSLFLSGMQHSSHIFMSLRRFQQNSVIYFFLSQVDEKVVYLSSERQHNLSQRHPSPSAAGCLMQMLVRSDCTYIQRLTRGPTPF